MPEQNGQVESFFPPQLQELVDKANELASKTEFSPNAIAGSDEHVRSLLPLQDTHLQQALLVRTQWNITSKDKKKDLEYTLPMDAARSIIFDRQLSALQQLAAMVIARSTLTGDQVSAMRGQNAAETIMQQRIRRNAATTLLSCYLIWNSEPVEVEAQSLWDRAHTAFDTAPRVKRPPIGDKADLDELGIVTDKVIGWGLCQRDTNATTALTGKLDSRFKIVNTYRAVKKRNAMIREAVAATNSDVGVLEFAVKNFFLGPALDLTSDEIHGSVRTARKMNRYLQSAGKIDPSITSDIRSRYFDTIIQHIDHCDEAAEKMLLKRDIQKFTTQLRKRAS